MSINPITNEVNLVKVVSAMFLHCKATIFPFVITKYLEEDTLRLCEYLVPVIKHIFIFLLR